MAVFAQDDASHPRPITSTAAAAEPTLPSLPPTPSTSAEVDRLLIYAVYVAHRRRFDVPVELPRGPQEEAASSSE
jgi:hypothetical protein